MQRREFLENTLASTAALPAQARSSQRDPVLGEAEPQVVIERAVSGKPHAGKVLATIAPHSDDHSILAGGTIAKLIDEGYTGYLIRTSNDEKDSYDLTLGPDHRRQRGRQRSHGQGAGHQAGLQSRLSQPSHGRRARASRCGPG